jgi:hypothetical protein
MDRWLLEYDADGEIYTLSECDDAAIERVMNSFDGRHTFYCCLYDTTDESCLWCVGEPDRRIVEGRLVLSGSVKHFVVRRPGESDERMDALRYGAEPTDLVQPATCEVLSAAEALAIFLAFCPYRVIPSEFEQMPGARLFGPN